MAPIVQRKLHMLNLNQPVISKMNLNQSSCMQTLVSMLEKTFLQQIWTRDPTFIEIEQSEKGIILENKAYTISGLQVLTKWEIRMQCSKDVNLERRTWIPPTISSYM
jgi:hypothetical protein